MRSKAMVGSGWGVPAGAGAALGWLLDSRGGLAVEGAGEVGADLDQLVEDFAVVLGVLVTLVCKAGARLGGAGVVGRLGMGGRGGHRGG